MQDNTNTINEITKNTKNMKISKNQNTIILEDNCIRQKDNRGANKRISTLCNFVILYLQHCQKRPCERRKERKQGNCIPFN